jgi:DNA uptake protein ComE-like DNA-binding protein
LNALEEGMKLTAIGLAAALSAVLAGCVVSQGTHEQVLQDLQATKSDLDRLRVQNESLNKQLKVLQDSRSKVKEDLDKANSEIASLNALTGKERQIMENRLKDLDRQVKEAIAAKRILAQDLEVQKQKYESAQKTIKRQQKELKEREQAELIAPPAKPFSAVPEPQRPIEPSMDGGKPASPPPRPATKPAPADQMKSAGPPSALAPVDINKASEADLVLTLGLGKEESQKLLKHRPYASKEELLTKAALPKATFDRIKDKITLSP